MRRDELYLANIVQAADAIARYLPGASEDTSAQSDYLRSAILRNLIDIGRAAGSLSAELRKRHSEVPWSDIVAFRNIAVHAVGHLSEELRKRYSEVLWSDIVAFQNIAVHAAGHLSEELRKRHSEVPWSDIVAFRNIGVHGYLSVNWPIVWTTANKEVPALRAQIAGILEEIHSGELG